MARERKFTVEELYRETRGLLLEYGYDGFTFSLLAGRMDISRSALYKYYENKEELITDYMLDEYENFFNELDKIGNYPDFDSQFHYLIDLIFQDPDLQELIKIGMQLPVQSTKKVRENKEKLDKLHIQMYGALTGFIQLGKDEGRIKKHLADGLVLGLIFQTITIPNHFGIPYSEWVSSIKEILQDGMFVKIDN